MIDIWNLWHREAALIYKDGQPVWENAASVFILPNSELSDEAVIEAIKGSLGKNMGAVSIQRVYFINMLYYAAARAQVGMKILGLEHEAVFISFDKLEELIPAINQLSAILAYKTKAILIERFAREMKDETVYYSTPLGDDDQGKPKLFLCSSQDSETVFFPVFLTEDHMRAFFEQEHRAGYMILKDTLQHFLSTLDANEKLRELGVVIEPLNSCYVAIPPLLRVDWECR
jgi:hypothetical protein